MVDKITVEVIRYGLEYIAEELGIILRNSSYSANIKERMDCSVAIFDNEARMLAQAEHIPVHLGAMPLCVKETIKFFEELYPGDVLITNDPYKGGTHLPDITCIAPIFYDTKIIGFVAVRAHHSDVGGSVPGSLPASAKTIFEEGLIIPPTKIVEKGELKRDILNFILSNTREPHVRKGDLLAQINACKIGVRRVLELVQKYGVKSFLDSTSYILEYAKSLVEKELSQFPKASAKAEDFLELDDKLVKIEAKVIIDKGTMTFDFRGSDEQVDAPLNATKAVTLSASYYVFRTILMKDIPMNEGAYQLLNVITKPRTLAHATWPAAVGAGNVETSQRIVDVLFKALAKIIPERIPAAGQGTMNNVCIGGIDPVTGKLFTFYETIGGGMGARPNKDGVDGIHVHMTNTMNTPIEEIEARFPILILAYRLRDGSGGAGKFRGGLGIERIYKPLVRVTVSLLGDRHKTRPYGLYGGLPGKPGEYIVLKKDGTKIKLKSKDVVDLDLGDILIIRTPGGGGYGPPQERDRKLVIRDLIEGKISLEEAEKVYGLSLEDIETKNLLRGRIYLELSNVD